MFVREGKIKTKTENGEKGEHTKLNPLGNRNTCFIKLKRLGNEGVSKKEKENDGIKKERHSMEERK